MAISKLIRFEVFKRDGFICGYCGRKPPEITLEIDHIKPRRDGGLDDVNNLVTSCFDCNRGKKHIPLERIPSKLSDNLEVLKEQESQISEYNKFVAKIRRRENKAIEKINAIYSRTFSEWCLSDSFNNGSLRNFIRRLPLHEVEEAMEIACSRKSRNGDTCINYFCGICWNKIKKSK